MHKINKNVVGKNNKKQKNDDFSFDFLSVFGHHIANNRKWLCSMYIRNSNSLESQITLVHLPTTRVCATAAK